MTREEAEKLIKIVKEQRTKDNYNVDFIPLYGISNILYNIHYMVTEPEPADEPYVNKDYPDGTGITSEKVRPMVKPLTQSFTDTVLKYLARYRDENQVSPKLAEWLKFVVLELTERGE
uniref:Uncharacterized protein n=1 Tax=viral metagenome TaxID=1070528 RepID=A0A6H1ZGU7_9ZZZZ